MLYRTSTIRTLLRYLTRFAFDHFPAIQGIHFTERISEHHFTSYASAAATAEHLL